MSTIKRVPQQTSQRTSIHHALKRFINPSMAFLHPCHMDVHLSYQIQDIKPDARPCFCVDVGE